MGLSSGDRVGRYLIDARLGEGPRGSVYRATREAGGRIVALKVLREDASKDAARVIASARAAAALDHPNIAAVVEVAEHEGSVYIARELVNGSPAIARKSATALEQRIRWLVEAAGALHAAHMRGVVHGAVGEGNVLIEEDGTLKLTDFGIGENAEAADDRQAWAALAGALIDESDMTAALRDALSAAKGSLDQAASMLERALSATRDLPIPEVVAAAGTVRTGATREASQVPRLVLVSVIIAASLVVLYATRRRPARQSEDSREAGAALAVVSSRIVPTQSPQALALFNGAMQSMHDGSIDLARAALNDALRLDPSFAAAHLRRALLSVDITDTSREHFGRATSLRNALSPHERVLLDGFEPVMHGDPLFALSVERMEAAVAKNPDDADFAYHLGFARWLAGDFHGAIAAMDRALMIDPHIALASRARAYLLSLLNQAPEAIAEYEHCLTLSPAATSCLYDLAQAQSRSGDCRGTEASARRMIAISPSSPNGYLFLARALTAMNQDEAASLALTEHLHRLPPESRSAQEASFDARRAILRGDFVSAERALHVWEIALAGITSEWDHAAVTEIQMEIALETGRSREAREAGSAFLARQSALTGASLHSDVRLIILGVMHRAQGISGAKLDVLRNDAQMALLDGGSSWRSSALAAESWLVAYITSVASAADAREALAMLPKYPPLPPEMLRDPVEVDGMIGRMYFLTGRTDEAIPSLRRAARSCYALDAPLFQTQLTKLLADAELAQGNTAEACADYADVIRRWGSSRAPSETARSAKSASDKAGCTPN